MISSIGQIINGHAYDFSSISVNINGTTIFSSFQEINYDWERSIGILRGNGSALKKARTRGQFNFTGSITLAKSDASALEKVLAGLGRGGFGEANWDLVVTYSEPGQGKPNVDTLISCTLIGGSNAHENNEDALVVSYDLDIMDILYDGISPAAPSNGGGILGAIGGLLP